MSEAFYFDGIEPTVRFECRTQDGPWRLCEAPFCQEERRSITSHQLKAGHAPDQVNRPEKAAPMTLAEETSAWLDEYGEPSHSRRVPEREAGTFVAALVAAMLDENESLREVMAEARKLSMGPWSFSRQNAARAKRLQDLLDNEVQP